MIPYKTLTANGVYSFSSTPYLHPQVVVKVDGNFAGATVEVGYIFDTNLNNGITDEGIFYKMPAVPLITGNMQYCITNGMEANIAVRVTNATAATVIYVQMNPVGKANR